MWVECVYWVLEYDLDVVMECMFYFVVVDVVYVCVGDDDVVFGLFDYVYDLE